MLYQCENCGEEFNVSSKKWAQRRGKKYKIFYCPDCYHKNLIPILMKYQRLDFNGERNQLV